MAFRKAKGDDIFADVGFRDFVGDPLPAVKQIYDFSGMPYTSETEAAIEAWHRDNPRFSEGKFDYDLSDYGSSDEEIEKAFEPYLKAYADFL